VGPYVKQGAVVSTHYSQVNALRTIEDVLGTQHLNLNTAFQRPMTEVFDVKSSGRWSYQAEASTVLEGTMLAQAPGGLACASRRVRASSRSTMPGTGEGHGPGLIRK